MSVVDVFINFAKFLEDTADIIKIAERNLADGPKE